MLKEWVKWNMPYIVMKRLLHDIKTVTSNIILSEVSVAWTYNLAYEGNSFLDRFNEYWQMREVFIFRIQILHIWYRKVTQIWVKTWGEPSRTWTSEDGFNGWIDVSRLVYI